MCWSGYWHQHVETMKSQTVMEYRGGYTIPLMLPYFESLPDEVFERDEKPWAFFVTREECEELVKYLKKHPEPMISY